MNRWLALGVLVATGVALGLRCPRMGIRPMHNDEAVNAIKFGGLWEQRTYRYDPHEFHGPLLAYSTALLSKLSGAPDFNHFSEGRLRAVTVLFGVGLLLPLLLLCLRWLVHSPTTPRQLLPLPKPKLKLQSSLILSFNPTICLRA